MFRQFVICSLMIFSSVAMAMSLFNETVPRKELMMPVIDLNVSLLERSSQSNTFKFKYSGFYSVNLVLFGTKQNEPPRAGDFLVARDFSLKGTIEIGNSDGVFITSPFKAIVASNQTGAYLIEFDVDKKDLDQEYIFSIRFDVTDQDMPLYFNLDKTRLYVRKHLKNSIFD